ncbi:MAG TPA: carbamoyltransferase HypF [Acidimicrobiales bacterium]|nr:carbamoyltransferase HypF [Acidimicrobiales bacterium]
MAVDEGARPPPSHRTGARVRTRARIEGIVQGVGFRPFVHTLATALGLAGTVGNDARGVTVEAEGDEEAVSRFLQVLEHEAPPLAVVEQISTEALPPTGEEGFVIVLSSGEGERHTLVSPDVATCDACLAEVFDPADRRYRYAFTNCTNCGPRFTIVADVPYDRANTTMARFPLCGACAAEYEDPANRRFHAQPVCCPGCGPQLEVLDARGRAIRADPVAEVVERLTDGQVVAIKGLGGYHLAALASEEAAVARLRSRKHREDKPFAVMAPDLAWAERLGHLDEVHRRLLGGWRRPIVLLARRDGESSEVARSVAPGNRELGVMLPYTPLHHLLAADLRAPFVLTSGNRSDEPIAYRDDEALERLAPIADAFLVHDRAIHTRVDDSVVAVRGGGEVPLRRSRGYAPMPLHLAADIPIPVLGVGAEAKATFCLAAGHRAFVSHHIGDLEGWETLRAYREGIEQFERLFDLHPAVLAHDLHPEYLSTKWAREQAVDDPRLRLMGVQHHHAHLASCLADNGEEGPAIGVVFDGLGYGADGTLWGGEFLVADLVGFDRDGHLETVPMPGGTAAITEPWRMAASWLAAAYGEALPSDLAVRQRHRERWEVVLAMARRGVNSPLTSSVGRLFDAVSAICSVRDQVTYEGQAAVCLEQAADPREPGAYPVGVRREAPVVVQGTDLVRAVVEDLAGGTPVSTVAARFHNGLADAVVAVCEVLRDRTALSTAALSGGVFQNSLLGGRVAGGLRRAGFRVLTHARVPPNDGGIALGQVAVAGGRLAGAQGPT